jgi:hypothetical protein
MKTFTRRSFLKTATVAAGAAAVSASPALAAAVEPAPVPTTASGPIVREPIVIVVRDPALGEITVLSGKTEKTYRDHALVKKLVKRAAI